MSPFLQFLIKINTSLGQLLAEQYHTVLKLNTICLLKQKVTEQEYLKSVHTLLTVALAPNQTPAFHTHLLTLTLFAVLLQHENGAKPFLEQHLPSITHIISQYCPINDLETLQAHELNKFKTIFTHLLQVIALSNNLVALQVLYPIVKLIGITDDPIFIQHQPNYLYQPLQAKLEKFILQTILSSYPYLPLHEQLEILKYFTYQFLDKTFDLSVRFSLPHLILFPLIYFSPEETLSEYFIQFYKEFVSILGQSLHTYFGNFQEQVQLVLSSTTIFQLFSIIFPKFSLQTLKNKLHATIIGAQSQGNEITKKLIEVSHNAKKLALPEFFLNSVYIDGKAQQLNGARITQNYYAQAYNCLAGVLMATQKKETLFIQFLLAPRRDKAEQLWELLFSEYKNNLDKQGNGFNFQVKQSFEMKSMTNFSAALRKFKAIPQTHLQNQLYRSENPLIKELRDGIIDQYFGENLLVQEDKSKQFLNNIDKLLGVEENREQQEQQKQQQQPLAQETQQIEFSQQARGNQMETMNQEEIKNNEQKENDLELDILNQHPSMEIILQLIDFMQGAFPGQQFSSDLPDWMHALYSELLSTQSSFSTKLYLLKMIINRFDIFKPFSEKFIHPFLNYLGEKNNTGGKGFHYFLRDCCHTVINWATDTQLIKKLIQNMHSQQRQLCISVVNNLVKIAADEQKSHFGGNIWIVKRFLELFKEIIYVDIQVIYKMLKLVDPPVNEQKKNEHGVAVKTAHLWRQNSLVVLEKCVECEIPLLKSYDELGPMQLQQRIEGMKYVYTSDTYLLLIQNLQHSHKQVSLCAASACGRILNQQFQTNQHKDFEALVIKSLTSSITKITPITSSIIDMIVSLYPMIFKTSHALYLNSFQLLKLPDHNAGILQTYTTFFSSLKPVIIEAHLSDFAMELQVTIESILSSQGVHQPLLRLLNQLADVHLANHSGISLMFTQIYQKLMMCQQMQEENQFYLLTLKLYTFFSKNQNQLLDLFINALVMTMFKGLAYQSKEIRTEIMNFLEKESILINDSPFRRLLQLLTQFFKPSIQQIWLNVTVPLLLSLSTTSSDYNRELFDAPLIEFAKFFSFDFQTANKWMQINRSQPLTPLFTLTQASQYQPSFPMQASQCKNFFIIYKCILEGQKSKLTLTQKNLEQISLTQQQNKMQPQPEQQQYAFIRMTQQSQPSLSQNLSNFETEKLFNSSLQPSFQAQKTLVQQQPQINALSQLTVQPSPPSLKDFIAPQPKRPTNKKGRIQNFYSSNAISFSSISLLSSNQVRYLPESSIGTTQRNQKIQKINLDQQQQQTSNLTRNYRLGELPDIEIKYKDLVSPMILLCLNDEESASDLFALLFLGLYSSEIQESVKTKAKELLEQVVGEGESATVVKSFLEIVRELERKGNGGFKGEQVVKVAERTGVVDRMVTVVEEIVMRGNEGDGLKRAHTDQRANEEWVALMQAYKLLGEHANINAIVEDKLGMEKKVSEALKMQVEGEMAKARKVFKEVIESEKNKGQQKEVVEYLEKQNKECLAALGMWEELEGEIKGKYQKQFEGAMVQQIPESDLEYYLISCFNQLGKWNQMTTDLTGWMQSSNSGKNYLESRFAYEIALVQITVNDLDRAKYYINIEEEEFLKRWQELTSSAATWKHHLAQRLQKIQELKEFLRLAQEKEIKQKQLNEVLGKWRSRIPGVESSIATIHELIQSRVLYSIWLQEHFSLDQQLFKKEQVQWLVSASHSMMNKGYLDVAEGQIRQALKLKRDGFIWDVVKVSAKLKFLQIQRSVKGLEDIKIAEKSFREIKTVLEKHRMKYNELEQLQELKIRRFELLCEEHFFHFVDDNFVEGVMNRSRSVWETFMKNVGAIQMGYEELLGRLEKMQLVKKKEIKFERKTSKRFANFCEKLLRMLECVDIKFQIEMEKQNNVFTLGNIAETFFVFTIKCLKLGEGDPNLVLKLIDVVQKYSGQLSNKFEKETESLPGELFLKWLPQMMYLLSGPIAENFGPLFLKIANEYPQEIAYHLNSSYNENREISSLVIKLYEIINQNFPLFDKFVTALRNLMHPEQRLQQFLEELKDIFHELSKGGDSEQGQLKIQKVLKTMETEFFDLSEDKCLGQYNAKFMNDWQKQIHKSFGQQYDKLNSNKYQDLVKKIQQIIGNIPKISTPPTTPVTHFTTFFQKYNDQLNEIFIPCTNVPLSNVSSTFETLSSIRKPKHLGFFSKSQKRYEFLIKGGEDLRLDQRIQQLFSEMNCGLILFKVVACDQKIGVVEWMQKTKTLRSIIESEVSGMYNSQWDIMEKNPVFTERLEWMKKRGKATDIVGMHISLLTADEKEIVQPFQIQRDLGPKGVLVSHLERIARNQEEFLKIRKEFIRHMANIGIAGYVLGIGDRHLENFLVNSRTAELIAIDFGYSFGQGVTLHLPELMPFRLTKIFLDVMAPVGVNGVFKQIMVQTMKKIREKKNVLLDCSEVFVKDPLLDVNQFEFCEFIYQWVKLAKKSNTMSSSMSLDSGSYIQHSLIEENQSQFQQIIWYPRKKIEIMKRKLLGHRSTDIMIEELKDNRHLKPSQVLSLQQVIKGGQFTLRGTSTVYQKEILSVEEQIDMLIDQAKDENILARTWIGWAPYI